MMTASSARTVAEAVSTLALRRSALHTCLADVRAALSLRSYEKKMNRRKVVASANTMNASIAPSSVALRDCARTSRLQLIVLGDARSGAATAHTIAPMTARSGSSTVRVNHPGKSHGQQSVASLPFGARVQRACTGDRQSASAEPSHTTHAPARTVRAASHRERRPPPARASR